MKDLRIEMSSSNGTKYYVKALAALKAKQEKQTSQTQQQLGGKLKMECQFPEKLLTSARLKVLCTAESYDYPENMALSEGSEAKRDLDCFLSEKLDLIRINRLKQEYKLRKLNGNETKPFDFLTNICDFLQNNEAIKRQHLERQQAEYPSTAPVFKKQVDSVPHYALRQYFESQFLYEKAKSLGLVKSEEEDYKNDKDFRPLTESDVKQLISESKSIQIPEKYLMKKK